MPALNKRKLSPEERKTRRKTYNDRYYNRTRQQRSKERERKVNLTCRVPEQILGIITRLLHEGIATGRYPWQNTGEAVTDLIKRGLASLKDTDDMVSQVWPGLQVSHQLETLQSLRRQCQTIVNRLTEEVTELEAVGAHQSALQFYWATMDDIRKMPATAFRDWAIKKLEKDFPHYAKAKRIPGVRLVHGK